MILNGMIPPFSMILNGEPLEEVDCFKYLMEDVKRM